MLAYAIQCIANMPSRHHFDIFFDGLGSRVPNMVPYIFFSHAFSANFSIAIPLLILISALRNAVIFVKRLNIVLFNTLYKLTYLSIKKYSRCQWNCSSTVFFFITAQFIHIHLVWRMLEISYPKNFNFCFLRMLISNIWDSQYLNLFKQLEVFQLHSILKFLHLKRLFLWCASHSVTKQVSRKYSHESLFFSRASTAIL